MSEKLIPSEGKKGKVQPPQTKPPDKKPAEGPSAANPVSDLQQQVGNRAVQRLVAQHQAGPAETDETTASQINQMRGSGQALDGAVQREMGARMGADFSGVNVHTSSEADDLNNRLGARAFTTGQDIFFRQGEYAPDSGSGKELLAHELTHVVQQGKRGELEPAAKMVVNPPDDAYEKEADTVAKQVTGPAAVQAQEDEMPREEEVQAKAIQRAVPEEEEPLQGKAIQRAALEEEEPLQGKRLQTQVVQREEMPREEELQTKAIQPQEMREDELQVKPVEREEQQEEKA